ncbi:probable sodium/potassium/calcium exchanger CG1090 isoform X2 [Condylostylus longicornis]|uniref:probable sodium/potassium/calcium exchanger CG1090 isoform X2 n=1 Tax=Condylostylus longicornis TaxID=2530218 RepID=UPI00244DF2CC|nr:probable sodium/potassium/calcium exchanger CG1090 isoform X2 [Condylostylus longicornis]
MDMRRSRRLRMWNLGILFIMYYCMSAYSQSDVSDIPEDTLAPNFGEDESTTIAASELPKLSDDATQNSTNVVTTPSPLNRHGKPTLRPPRINCTPPAIEQFPRPLMPRKARLYGGLIIHFVVAIFSFLGLAIVCDDYFVASLDRLCEELKLSPDVAGATFMAAGSSAPELATVVIGVFFAKDDIGISGVIGSAVFNIMFVISVCALCSGTVCQLNWWPLVRDCFFYCLSILLMLLVIVNDYISWFESVIMLVFYVIYCVTLHFNTPLERWAMSLNLPIKLPTKEEQSSLVTYKNVPDTSYTQDNQQQVTSLTEDPSKPSNPYEQSNDYQNYNDPNSSWDPNSAWGDESSAQPVSNTGGAGRGMAAGRQDDWGTGAWDQGEGQQNYAYNPDNPDQGQQDSTKPPAGNTNGAPKVGEPGPPEYYKSKDPKAREPQPNPLEKPADGGLPKLIYWHVVYPIHYVCMYTMPDCRTEKFRNWYPFTFVISMVWISFFSYFMVWMITIIGSTLGIPDTVMGLTFVAAGVSVPDALSSIAVIKEGYGDMAVSNAVGSNVFDILVCLGLPWLIQTAIISPGSHVNVISKGLAYSTLSLFSTVLFLLVSIHLNGWKLDKRLGIILMVWYLLFITLASLYELNVFGNWNPPECSTTW